MDNLRTNKYTPVAGVYFECREGLLVGLLLLKLDVLDDFAIVFEVLPEQYLAALDVHCIFRAMELFAELCELELARRGVIFLLLY